MLINNSYNIFSISLVFLGFTIGIYISLRVLSGYISCMGIYYEDESYIYRFRRVLKYYFFLSLPLFFVFYLNLKQILPSMNDTVFLLSILSTSVILIVARLLVNPTCIIPKELKSNLDSKAKFEELCKIQERMVSFFYGIVALNIITLVITIMYYLFNPELVTNSTYAVTNSTYACREPVYLLSIYFSFLIFSTLISEIFLGFYPPLLKFRHP